MADRHDIAAADEQMRLAEGDPTVDHLRGARDDEERVAILLELGMLMRLAGILDGQVSADRTALHPLQKLVAGLEQADPDDMTGPLRPLARLFDRYICDPPAAA